jgi:DNA-3-methyladenine glycosylase
MARHGRRVLRPNFFRRPAALVARELLGMELVRNRASGPISSIITETEAYEGQHDLASHSSRGRTRRTEVMFGPAGRFYVYLVYGLHWMLNVTAGEPGDAAAVLIRGLEAVSGPARLTAALGIDGSFNGLEAAMKNGLWFEDRSHVVAPEQVLSSARIGVEYAGSKWAEKKLRFVLKGSVG